MHLKVTANSSGEGVSGIPYKLEHKRCEDSARWKTIVLGLTDSKGVDQKSFKFFDTADFCDYRVVAAYGVKGAKQIVFPIATFQRQAIDKESKLNLKILSKQ